MRRKRLTWSPLKFIPDISQFETVEPHELTIPGDAEKFIAIDPKGGRYIAKAPKKWGLIETLTEYFINCIGMSLNFNCSISEIGKIRQKGGEYDVRFMSLHFHGRKERLTHGIQMFSQFYSQAEITEFEKGRKERNLYTVENIKAAFDLLFPDQSSNIFRDFVLMCVFDALVGNQDRHAKNWGVIEPIDILEAANVRFAPIFDTARGFFWNHPDDKLTQFGTGDGISRYIENGRPQIATAGHPDLKHFDLVGKILELYPDQRKWVRTLVVKASELDIDSILAKKLFQTGFSPFRRSIIKRCYSSRVNRLKGVAI
jgi:hypothetical protein